MKYGQYLKTDKKFGINLIQTFMYELSIYDYQ